jgi:ribosomal protein L40E
MSLLERVRAGLRLCVDCGAHEPIADSDRCRDCLNAYLRETRPQALRQPAWIERSRQQPHGLARDLSDVA